jgi:hypothetical protein
MSLVRDTVHGRKNNQRSTRSLRREAIAKATVLRVKAEQSILERKGLVGKHLTDKQRKKLYANVKDVFAIAYAKNPELFSYAGT